MIVETVAGVAVDACTEHGMWLDSGELERIQLNKFKAGSRKRRERLAATRKKSRIEGWFYGLWALGFD